MSTAHPALADPGGTASGRHDALIRLLRIRELLGPRYGSEDLCVLLYSLVRRERPRIIVELGTGLAVSALWMAQAAKENGVGHVFTLDDGRHFERAFREVARAHGGLPPDLVPDAPRDLISYVRDLSHSCGVAAHVSLRQVTFGESADDVLPPGMDFGGSIDLLFADFAHGPEAIVAILAFFLPRLSECASIFIDSASTHLPSYLLLEHLIEQLNRGKMPAAFRSPMSRDREQALGGLVGRRTFRLMHLIERKDRDQNSTTWIRIEPTDWRPQPLVRLH